MHTGHAYGPGAGRRVLTSARGGVRPNFFIVGAPKCGTTAVVHFLREHPDVFIPSIKEPNWFNRDFDVPRAVHSRSEYEALFAPGAGAPRRGEGTVGYLYSRVAPHEINGYSPDARIVIMLRDPVDMLPSLHAQFIFEGFEDIRDFGQALDAEAPRLAGGPLPRGVRDPKLLAYSNFANYAAGVRRYRRVFGADSVHVILFDDFKADPAGTYRALLEFLGVPGHEPDFRMVNPAKEIRNWRLHQWVCNPPRWLRGPREIPDPTTLRGEFLYRLKHWNTRTATKKPLDPALRARLVEMCQPRVRELEEELGRKLEWAR